MLKLTALKTALPGSKMPATAISLFSGCGGDSFGLERAGYKIIAFNEFNKAAIETHTQNFPESILLQDKSPDITKVPDSVFQPYKGKVDIVFAGFPCQGFSRAGKKKANDPRNQMYLQFVRVVKNTEPKFFIGENVTGLQSMKSGPGENDPLVLDNIRKAFGDIGYDMTYKVLEAVDYGVPQKRKRILLVGWRKDRVTNFDPASFWASVSEWGSKQKLPKLRSFVTNSLECAYKLKADEVPTGFQNNALLVSDDVMPTGSPHPFVVLKAGEKLLSCTKRDSPIHSEIIDVDKPSKTIICTYDHQPRLLVGLKKPNGDCFVRTLLPDELKQIQGFPATFQVTGNGKEKVVQIGNAVPPALVQAVAEGLKKIA